MRKDDEKNLIGQFDPKPAIRRGAETARDWEFHEEAEYLYGMAVIFKDRFLDPILLTDRGRLPDPVISFDDLRNRRTLAAYTLNRNPQGLLDEITFNTAHYEEDEKGKKIWKWGRWAQMETLLHEQLHLLQENFLNKHTPGRVHHDKVFVAKAKGLGLNVTPVQGSHFEIADEGSPFAFLMEELGIERPKDVPRIDWGKTGGHKRTKDWFRPDRERGRSTLQKWECPDCGLKVRLGIGSDPRLIHDVCSEARGEKVFLVKHDGLSHTIYKGNK